MRVATLALKLALAAKLRLFRELLARSYRWAPAELLAVVA